MLFKANSQHEFKNPFPQTEFDRHYPIFEVTLNVGLFHVDLTISYFNEHIGEEETCNNRLIGHDLDQILRTINQDGICKADLYYQTPIRDEEEGYRIMKVKTVKSDDNGLTFTFSTGEVHKDTFQHSRERGIVFKA